MVVSQMHEGGDAAQCATGAGVEAKVLGLVKCELAIVAEPHDGEVVA